MMHYILTLSLIIWGIAALFTDGMILEKLGDILIGDKIDPKHYAQSSWFNRKWHKPVFSCPVCMSSFWGSLASLYLYTFHVWSAEQWLCLVFGTCGLNFIITRILDR